MPYCTDKRQPYSKDTIALTYQINIQMILNDVRKGLMVMMRMLRDRELKMKAGELSDRD